MLGLFIGIGGAFFRAWIAEHDLAGDALRWLAVALIAGLVATPVSVGLQGLDALDLPLPACDASSPGKPGWRPPMALTAIAAAFALCRRPVRRGAASRLARRGFVAASACSASASRWR